jgi:hypothetical protein
MDASHPDILRDIDERKAIGDDTRTNLLKALDAFRNSWQSS